MILLAYLASSKAFHPSFLRMQESMILLVILSSSRVLTVIPANPSFLRKQESIRLAVNANLADGFLLSQE